jgi:hypothetical protein
MARRIPPLSELSDVSPMVARLRRRYLVFMVAVSLAFFVLAFTFAALPNLWFVGDLFTALDHFGRSAWPKLAHDAAILDERVPLRGTKYVILMQCCLGMTIVACVAVLPVNWRLISLPSNWVSYPVAKGLGRAFLIGILFLGFVVFFDPLLIGSDARKARGITNSFLLWFWMPLLWWCLAMVVSLATVIAAQIWKHGWPESEEEYRARKGRGQKIRDDAI